jgi:hypothetical protein
MYIQSGFDREGLATTIPAEAPWAFDPSAPIFASTPLIETATWLFTNPSIEVWRFSRSTGVP